MTADLARKRARQQNSPTDPLRLDRSWETNPESMTLPWTCQTCESLSLPLPWLEQTNEKCAAGKPTDHKGKTRARPLLVRQGFRACVRLCPAVPLLPSKRQKKQTQTHSLPLSPLHVLSFFQHGVRCKVFPICLCICRFPWKKTKRPMSIFVQESQTQFPRILHTNVQLN